MRLETYNSPNGLMNGIRFMVIELVQDEISRVAMANPLYRNILIRKPGEVYVSGSDSISVYIEIDVSLVDHSSDSGLEIIVRLSDHPSDTMKDGDIHEDDGETKTFIVREVGEAIRVRGRNGIEHRWNDLDRDTHRVPLINGRDAVLPGDVRIEGRGSKYYIDPSKRKVIGTIINRIRSDVMDCIHTFVHQADS